MRTSRIIEFDGVFIGAAIALPDAQGWRFVSADSRSSGADGRTAATLDDTRVMARRAFVTHRLKLGCQSPDAAAA
jgi:hypothetical protein